ncbi:MAG: InlB B-repeat-containing protein [Bacilli bacterium]|nr:InlB B-repeat-containing protein [Bacilli bacterium]
MKRNGFVFVESIVVLVVVALSLAMLLSSYSLVQRKTKEKEYYDKSSDKYLLYAISDLGTDDTCSYSIRCKNGDTVDTTINFRADVDEFTKNGPANPYFCKNTKLGRILYSCDEVLKSMQVRSIYVVKDISSALKSPDATNIYDNGVIEYMKTLKKCNDENTTGSAKRNQTCSSPIAYMIGVFERGNNDLYYASINLSGNVDSESRPNPEPDDDDAIELVDNKFKVTYFRNGGSACNPEYKMVTYDEEYGNLCETSRTGRTFKGWYLEPELVYRIDPTTIVKTARNHTLYAKWESNSAYITYEGASCIPATKLVKFAEAYGTLCSPSKEGYQFGGWYLESALSTLVNENTSVSVEGDHTLYAKWNPNRYTIKFAGNNNTGGSTANATCYYNSPCTLTTNGFTRDGYVFDGWSYNGSTYDNGATINSNLTSTNNAQLTFTARWKSTDPFKFAYNGAFRVIDGSTTRDYEAKASGTTTVTISNKNWKVYLYTGGTLNVISISSQIDIFAVGGGGGGAGTLSLGNRTWRGGCGGGGGAKVTSTVTAETGNHSVTIGTGGDGGKGYSNSGSDATKVDGKNGTATTITIGGSTISAAGGTGGQRTVSGSTSCAGGRYSTAANSPAGAGPAGVYPFEDSSYGIKYGAGGGGGQFINCNSYNETWCSGSLTGSGGANGGGAAGNGKDGSDATNNSGSGGGAGGPASAKDDSDSIRPRNAGGKGGTGIIIMRNHSS